MAGYPLVDKLYYESPSIRIGGFVAYVLKLSNSNRLNILPGRSKFCTIPFKHFESLQELANYLKQEHRVSVYYRGQTRRYQATYQGHIKALAEAFPELTPLEITFENMVPSLFRPILIPEYPDWDNFLYPRTLDSIAPAVRAIIKCKYEPVRNLLKAYFQELIGNPEFLIRPLCAHLGAIVPLPSELTAPMTNISKTLLQLISISQHYEYGSIMTDITSNVDVAAWFASHEWSSGERAVGRVEDSGVIYRFNAGNINRHMNKELENETPAAPAISASGLLGIADISNLGDEFGLRPKRQYGGSILGTENSIVNFLFDVCEGLEVFTFPLNSTTGKETQKNKVELCPSQDPLVNVFDPMNMHLKEPIKEQELTHFLENEKFTKDEIGVILRARKMNLI